ncbi:hypothetical protein [Candidatus Enterococcus clewellii]|uniref:CAAX amino terminal protease n=1 Tax=Candidatus Enterococcus clewellii TaxID=1834193 RepID=A0A242K4R2_9ENTE|nr:hypothetical protein A5888_002524 [Enterococcus sp. 9E7_DIV0242]
MEKPHTPPVEFLWLGLYGFAGFSLELILGMVVGLFQKNSLDVAVHAAATAILWFGAAYLLMQYAKRKFGFDLFEPKESLENILFLPILGLVVVIIIVSTVGFGGFKPIVEFTGSLQHSIPAFIFRNIYYLAESSLIVVTIAFGQKFFEKQFSLSEKLPLGGLFLALTWGLMHILLQGFMGGLYTVFFSLAAGGIFILCKKDIRWTYLFVALAFIL